MLHTTGDDFVSFPFIVNPFLPVWEHTLLFMNLFEKSICTFVNILKKRHHLLLLDTTAISFACDRHLAKRFTIVVSFMHTIFTSLLFKRVQFVNTFGKSNELIWTNQFVLCIRLESKDIKRTACPLLQCTFRLLFHLMLSELTSIKSNFMLAVDRDKQNDTALSLFELNKQSSFEDCFD